MIATDALTREYSGLAWHISGRYYAGGMGREDLVQEALTGLVYACRDYQPALGPFPPFAMLCMERRVQTVVKTSLANSHRLLTDAERVTRTDEDEETPAVDMVLARTGGPAELLEQRDEFRRLTSLINQLPVTERRAIIGVCLEGRPYRDLGKPKTIDNALYRARARLKAAA